MRAIMMIVVFLALPIVAQADDRLVRLHAPAELVDSGLMKHILPRSVSKRGVKVELVGAPETANVALGSDNGRAMFQSAGTVWHMRLRTPDHPGTEKFANWISSEVGMRTITSFAPEGVSLFEPPTQEDVEVVEVTPGEDAELGYKLSRTNCGRCHAVDEAGKKNDIGSTPSFFVLRAFPDWEDRFGAFYALKPHGAFTQIKEITEPFPEGRPPPIVPIELTVGELEAVMAYVAALKAADLGAPLEHQ